MKWLKTFALIVTVIVCFLMATLAVNTQELTLSFAAWQTPVALPMFWWLLAAFVIGLSAGLLNALWINLKHRLELRKLRQTLDQNNAELERLRSLTVQS